MYLFSDLVYFLIYYMIGYRRKVVSDNLHSSFPEKNEAEIMQLTKKFYHHLCDISIESIKGFSMSPQELILRHHILNPELAEYYYSKGLSVITVPGHYNNWEWGFAIARIADKISYCGFLQTYE